MATGRAAVLKALILFAAGLAAAAPAAAREQGPWSGDQDAKVLVAFLPQDFDERAGLPLLPVFGRLAAPERGGQVALGLTSPSLGLYIRQQVLLDISAGSRISTRTYPDELGAVYLRRAGDGGKMGGWGAVVDRARAGPGEIVPGLLGETVARAGGSTAYAGVAGSLQGESIVATDARGRIDTVSVGGDSSLVRRVEELLADHRLVVTRVPRGRDGERVLGRLVAEREPGEMVYAMVAPTLTFGLLPTAVAAEGYGGLLSSSTTRRPGLVTATDLAPTALDHLGLGMPAEMQGRPAASVAAEHPEARLRALNNRQEDVTGRRIPALALTLGAWVVLMAALALARRPGAVRAGLRIGFLALVWMPSLALATAALDPPAWGEYAILALGSLLLAALCDRLLPWPGAPVLPVAVMLVAHTIDLIGNSALIVGSLAGPTPRGGARFFGVGNELETIISVGVLLGAGAALAWRPSPRAPLLFALVAIVTAVVIGAGRLGADVGGVITLAAGAGGAVLASLHGGPSWRAIALAVLAPVVAVAALVLVDLVSGGDAHFSRFVLDAGGSGELADTVRRRLDLAWSILLSGTRPYSVIAFIAVIVYGVWRRERLMAPMRAALGVRAATLYAAGLYGTLAAIVIGSLANDSGPIIFLVGSVALVLAAGYGWAAPRTTASR